MSEYSFPNPADDLKSRLVYTVAAEFIYRLDLFLECERRDPRRERLSIDTIEVVKHCCEAAINMLCGLVGSWANGSLTWVESLEVRPEQLPVNSPKAAELILRTMEVLAARLPATPCVSTSVFSVASKWELMFTLGTEFFLELGIMAEEVFGSSDGSVDGADVEMIRGCLDAAMGMVYELMSVAWPDGLEAPARALLAMHDHVISCRLEDSGHEAVSLIRYVYGAVTSQVREEH